MDTEVIGPIVEQATGRSMRTWTQLAGGNSRVYRIGCDGDMDYVVKVYPSMERDPRDRLQTEFSALSYLWNQRMRCVPRPIHADPTRRIGVYEFVPGERIDTGQIQDEDIDSVVAFAGLLSRLGTEPESAAFPPASEASFTFQGYLDILERRLRPLSEMEETTDPHRMAGALVRNEIVPFFQTIRVLSYESLAGMSLEPSDELPRTYRTLSPSDFGFHNAIRRPDGCMVFLDFEYFGWDDPAKMMIDFVQHPAQRLPEAMSHRFQKAMFALFDREQTLPDRVRLLFPVLGIKWCLIMLNEFLPGYMNRRKAAGAFYGSEKALENQLDKARRRFEAIRRWMDSPGQPFLPDLTITP